VGNNGKKLEAAFQQIEDELRTQYVASYTPSNTKLDGTFAGSLAVQWGWHEGTGAQGILRTGATELAYLSLRAIRLQIECPAWKCLRKSGRNSPSKPSRAFTVLKTPVAPAPNSTSYKCGC
jgi:hypothetical protein